MLRFLLGVAVGATLVAMARHVYREREKQHLVNEIAKLHEWEDRDGAGQ